MDSPLEFSSKIFCLPVVHGSGDFAIEARRVMLNRSFDCLAVPLPESLQPAVEQGILQLPNITVAVQEETDPAADPSDAWKADRQRISSYVPIDPCQPVIAALRVALQEHIPRAFIDLEVEQFEERAAILPDPYALKQLPAETFATATLPVLPPPDTAQQGRRIQYMAQRLHELERRFESILIVCSISDWPWLRDAYARQTEFEPVPEIAVHEAELFKVAPETLLFLLGELPFITGRYEQARSTLEDDENLSVDGVKDLLLESRQRYQSDLKSRGRTISTQLMSLYLKYVRNLSLIDRRMTPDLYTLVTAAKQMAGDTFAVSLAEVAREYPFQDWLPFGEFRMGLGRGEFPNGSISLMKNRLPGHPVVWRTLELNRRPPEIDKQKWAMRWNPYSQCSWPPEDVKIERFRTHVKDRALSMLGNDLARVEKFTTSIKDGLDIRETLRNWHTGDIYVKENPPSRGSLDCVMMLFDSPADPRDYPWRLTWQAENQDESTLSFFATDFIDQMVGPGIAQSTYGGAMFLFPPRSIPDVWRDRTFDFADTLEERLLAAACHYSKQNHIAILSAATPGAGWRRLAKRYSKKLIHVPLSHFSQETIQGLRHFHVLNGHHVRSFADHFIRKS